MMNPLLAACLTVGLLLMTVGGALLTVSLVEWWIGRRR